MEEQAVQDVRWLLSILSTQHLGTLDTIYPSYSSRSTPFPSPAMPSSPFCLLKGNCPERLAFIPNFSHWVAPDQCTPQGSSFSWGPVIFKHIIHGAINQIATCHIASTAPSKGWLNFASIWIFLTCFSLLPLTSLIQLPIYRYYLSVFSILQQYQYRAFPRAGPW